MVVMAAAATAGHRWIHSSPSCLVVSSPLVTILSPNRNCENMAWMFLQTDLRRVPAAHQGDRGREDMICFWPRETIGRCAPTASSSWINLMDALTLDADGTACRSEGGAGTEGERQHTGEEQQHRASSSGAAAGPYH